VKLHRVHFASHKILITSLWSCIEYTSPRTKFLSQHSEFVSSTHRKCQTSSHIIVKLHRVHLATDKRPITSLWSCIEYPMPQTNLLSHYCEVVSSTHRQGQTSYHIIVKLYRVHIARVKPLITSLWSFFEYTSPGSNLLSHHCEVVSSTHRQGQTSYHIIVKFCRVHIARVKPLITSLWSFFRVHFARVKPLITSLWSFLEYTSPGASFLSHHSEVVSSTLRHGHTSYHIKEKLYRVHYVTDKLPITSYWSCIEYTSTRTNFLSHHSEVVSSALRHGQASCHIIVKLYRIFFATDKPLITCFNT
jgi:DNA-binding transcriptional regulator PaaX